MREKIAKFRGNKAPTTHEANEMQRQARQGDERHLGVERANALRADFAHWLLDPAVARQPNQQTVETYPTPEQAAHYKALLLQGAHGLASGELKGAAIGELMVAAEMLGGTSMPDGRRLVMKDKALSSQAALVGAMAKSVAFMEMSAPYQNEYGRMETTMYPGLEAQHEAVKMMNECGTELAAAYKGQSEDIETRLGASPEETVGLFNGIANRLNKHAAKWGVAQGHREIATGKVLFEDPVRTISLYGEENNRTLAVNLPVYHDRNDSSTP